MIKVNCIKCKQELNEPGGILFLPPKGINVQKYHLCIKCCSIFVDKTVPSVSREPDVISLGEPNINWELERFKKKDDWIELIVILLLICLVSILFCN